MAEHVKAEIAKLAAEVAGLRADLQILRAITKGEIVEIGRKAYGRDVAEEAAAALEAKYVADVTNAVLAAQAFNAIRCSRGVAVMVTIIAGNDPAARVGLAQIMLQLAHELDADLDGAATWQ